MTNDIHENMISVWERVSDFFFHIDSGAFNSLFLGRFCVKPRDPQKPESEHADQVWPQNNGIHL